MDEIEFLRHFENCTLPFEQWTHRTHVKVGHICLRQHSFTDALDRIRVGIKRYNAHNQVPESETSGYNETTTHAMLHLIAATMSAYRKTHAVDSAEAFCDMHPQLMNKHVLRLFYSPQRRMHAQAKTQFIEPDLAPLSKIIE